MNNVYRDGLQWTGMGVWRDPGARHHTRPLEADFDALSAQIFPAKSYARSLV